MKCNIIRLRRFSIKAIDQQVISIGNKLFYIVLIISPCIKESSREPIALGLINFKSSRGLHKSANNVYYIDAGGHAEITEYRKSNGDDDGAQFACFRSAAKQARSRENTRLCNWNLHLVTGQYGREINIARIVVILHDGRIKRRQ